MANIFSSRADLILRASVAFVGVLLVGGSVAWVIRANPMRSVYVGFVEPQPVMFSHEHHVGRLGLDCRYCHQHAEDSDFAGLPAASTCMNCHLQLYTTAPMLEPIRDAWSANRPVAWRRVTRIPDFVRFSHKPHVTAGVACVSCHGRMDEQPLTQLAKPMTMGWCLDCHRQPDSQLVDLAAVFSPEAQPGSAPVLSSHVAHRELLTNCSACHY